MLLLARCCWRNEDDGDMLDRVAWNAAAYVGEMLKRMFLWW